MARSWVTTASSNVQAMTNSLTAACDEGFIPDDIHILEMSDVAQQVDAAIDDAVRTIEAYGGDEPEIHFTSIDEEVDFERIHDHVRSAIQRADEAGDEVAVEITSKT